MLNIRSGRSKKSKAAVMCLTDCGSQPFRVKGPFENLLKASDRSFSWEQTQTHIELRLVPMVPRPQVHQGPSVEPGSVSLDNRKEAGGVRGRGGDVMRPLPYVLAGDRAHVPFPLVCS